MNAEAILSILRLCDFNPAVHQEAQRSTQWPGMAIIPHVLPCGTANIAWALATYRVAMHRKETILIRIRL